MYTLVNEKYYCATYIKYIIFESKSVFRCGVMSRIMFGMRSEIKELVKLIKLVIVKVI